MRPNGEVVRELKRRKGRPDKPLAVMVADLEELRRHCPTDAVEAELLASPEQPIVLVRWPAGEAATRVELGDGEEPGSGEKLAARSRAGSAVGTGVPESGAEPSRRLGHRPRGGRAPALPGGDAAVHPPARAAPAGGRSAPRHDERQPGGGADRQGRGTSSARLGEIPDYYLVHDRDIYARYDDSVALVRAGRPRLVRRSRGYAPFPVALPRALPQVLACGAELKNSFCLTRDANAFVSQHIGDLENLETLEHFEASRRAVQVALPARARARRLRPAP